MFNKNNKISVSYILLICLTVFLSLVFFTAFFLLDKIEPLVGDLGNIFKHEENSVLEPDAQQKLTVSQETENYESIIARYSNYLNSNYLIVVNKENPLPEGYAEPTLSSVSNSARKLEERAAAALQELFAAADEAGCKRHVVISGYRTAEEQTTAFNTKVQEFMNSGYTQPEAELRATATVAKAGESEFQTGFLVEIGENRTMTSDDFVKTDLYNFLKDNAHLYGFIIRYPESKSAVTGYEFNSMIFRYVGNVDSSTYIYENNLTLEEYIDYMKIAKLDAEQKLEFFNQKNEGES